MPQGPLAASGSAGWLAAHHIHQVPRPGTQGMMPEGISGLHTHFSNISVFSKSQGLLGMHNSAKSSVTIVFNHVDFILGNI